MKVLHDIFLYICYMKYTQLWSQVSADTGILMNKYDFADSGRCKNNSFCSNCKIGNLKHSLRWSSGSRSCQHNSSQFTSSGNVDASLNYFAFRSSSWWPSELLNSLPMLLLELYFFRGWIASVSLGSEVTEATAACDLSSRYILVVHLY